ncbi:MAG: IS5 family transposase, partial [Endozoicomonas sp.]|uniref:IS5 family transposase n=1 Tax=Endozoicomonas sp. TaxID=1892382 RepID=UPI003D9B5B4D
AGLSLDQPIPDHSTILHFRHLLENHKLGRKIFHEINEWLGSSGIVLKEGTLVDATIIEAPTSTKNKEDQRDPEMHQTKKGNQWHFGMKAHIGVDARTGLTHSLETTAANEHDLNQMENLLHGDESFVGADAGYRGAEKREELSPCEAEFFIAEQPSKVKALKEHPHRNRVSIKLEYLKASIRAKVEHPFRIVKCQFGFVKTAYRGLEKNDNKLATLFALANVVRLDQMIRRA